MIYSQGWKCYLMSEFFAIGLLRFHFYLTSPEFETQLVKETSDFEPNQTKRIHNRLWMDITKKKKLLSFFFFSVFFIKMTLIIIPLCSALGELFCWATLLSRTPFIPCASIQSHCTHRLADWCTPQLTWTVLYTPRGALSENLA